MFVCQNEILDSGLCANFALQIIVARILSIVLDLLSPPGSCKIYILSHVLHGLFSPIRWYRKILRSVDKYVGKNVNFDPSCSTINIRAMDCSLYFFFCVLYAYT